MLSFTELQVKRLDADFFMMESISESAFVKVQADVRNLEMEFTFGSGGEAFQALV